MDKIKERVRVCIETLEAFDNSKSKKKLGRDEKHLANRIHRKIAEMVLLWTGLIVRNDEKSFKLTPEGENQCQNERNKIMIDNLLQMVNTGKPTPSTLDRKVFASIKTIHAQKPGVKQNYTGDDFFKKLDQEFNFTLDPCATVQNKKCKKFFTKEEDGLKQDWSKEIVFMNHPNWDAQRSDGIARLSPVHEDLIKKKLIHGVEVVNETTFSEEALKIALESNLTIIGNSDIHGLTDWLFEIPEGGHRPITFVISQGNKINQIIRLGIGWN